MRLIKQTGEKQADFVFLFNEYVEGWEQIVEVNFKNNLPHITSIIWKLAEKEDENSEDGKEVVALNASTYREFPIGEVTDRVASYALLKKYQFHDGNKEIKDFDYGDVLDLAYKFVTIYPVKSTKWKDERNSLFYLSYYLLEVNNYWKLENKTEKDLHQRIADRVEITKTNSIQVLNRLKENGYLISNKASNSLLPSVKSVNKLLRLVKPAEKLFEQFKEKVELIVEKNYSELFSYWEQNWSPEENKKYVFLIDGEEYEDPENFESLSEDEYSGFSLDYTDGWQEVELSEDEISALASEAFSDEIESWETKKELLDELDLWSFDNKYIQSVDEDMTIYFKIEDEILDLIRLSDKYQNDIELFLNEKLIDEILSDFGIEDYLAEIEVIEKWDEQSNNLNPEKPIQNYHEELDEFEAPF